MNYYNYISNELQLFYYILLKQNINKNYIFNTKNNFKYILNFELLYITCNGVKNA